MKTKLTFIFLLLSLSSTFAQINKGAWLIGGLTGISSTHNSTGGDHSTSAFIRPEIGYFPTQRWMFGTVFSLEQRDFRFTNSFGTSESVNHTLLLNPYVRYYLVNRKWQLFLQHSFSYQNNISKGITNAISSDFKKLQNRLGIGSSILLSPNVAIEGTLEWMWFQQEKLSFDPEVSFLSDLDNTLFFPSSLSLNIGIQLFLNDNSSTTSRQDLSTYYFQKGNYRFSGQATLENNRQNDIFFSNRPFFMNISPHLSYFLTPYWTVQTGLNLSYQKTNNNQFNNLGGSLRTSYYVPIWKKFYLEPQIRVGLSQRKETFTLVNFQTPSETVILTSQTTNWTGSLKAHYFLTNQVILQAAYSLEQSFTKNTQTESSLVGSPTKEFRSRHGAWTIGLEYFLNQELSMVLSYLHQRINDDNTDETLNLNHWKTINSGFSVRFNYLLATAKNK